MTDEELARASLDRAVAEHRRRSPTVGAKDGARLPHAPLRVGATGEHPYGGMFVHLLVMKPCECGQHVSDAVFRDATLDRAYRKAKQFVEAITPPEQDDEDDDDDARSEAEPPR